MRANNWLLSVAGERPQRVVFYLLESAFGIGEIGQLQSLRTIWPPRS